MSSQPRPRQTVRFGPFDYDPGSEELRKHGTRIRLRGQPLQILSILLEHPGEVVPREEFQRRLWSGTTFVDFEHGLNAAVNKLRQALGDTAGHSRYIETAPGQGYRFVGLAGSYPERTVLTMAPPLAEPQPKARRWWIAIAAGVALAAGAYFAVASFRQPLPLPAAVRFSVAAPPGFAMEPGSSREIFALSPDGSRLAFLVADASGASYAWVRDGSSVEPQLVADSAGAHVLFWGANNDELFLGVRGRLRRISLGGTAYQDLGALPPYIGAGTVLNSGEVMVSSSLDSYRVPVVRSAMSQPMGQLLRWPQLLPGGQVLSTSIDPHTLMMPAKIGDRVVLEAESKVRYTASQRDPSRGYLVYVRGGNLVAHPFDPAKQEVTAAPIPLAANVYGFATGNADFAVAAQGAIAYQQLAGHTQLTWVDRQGGKLGSIGPANSHVKWARLSPDGAKAATALYEGGRGASIWIYDVKTGFGRKTVAANPHVDAPIWSNDGRRIAYYFADGRFPNPAIRGLGESDREQRFPSHSFQQPTDWSRDGRYLVLNNTGFAQVANDLTGDLWIIDLERGGPAKALTQTAYHEANAAFSPDSKWLAFTSNESGRAELFVQAFTAGDPARLSGERIPVSQGGAAQIRWRVDGRELFFLGGDGWIYAVSVRAGAVPRFGKPERLFQIALEARNATHSLLGFDVTPDGKRFLIPAVTSNDYPVITVVQNWESDLP